MTYFLRVKFSSQNMDFWLLNFVLDRIRARMADKSFRELAELSSGRPTLLCKPFVQKSMRKSLMLHAKNCILAHLLMDGHLYQL
mmetsp:Transcript_26200/g.36580  ORF Transcript_26200/g.36580 Transcript_26200/m.36580 type:complete len:84 (+) Transcript_26200:113-364(+)